MNSNAQYKLGAIISYLAIIINIVSALVYSPWMLSMVGDSDYGLYSLASALINMFLLDFGISAAVTRFVSKFNAEGKQDEINNMLGLVYRLFILIAGVISAFLIGIYFFIDKIYAGLTLEEIEKLKIVYVIAAAFTVLSFPLNSTVNGILTSYEKFIPLRLSDLVGKILSTITIIFSLLLGGGLYTVVTITAAGNFLVLIFKFIIIRKILPIKIRIRGAFQKSLFKEIFNFSFWALLNTISSRMIMSLCPNILGITASTFAITVFSFSGALEGYTYTFASAIDGMFMPKIARIYYKAQEAGTILSLMTKIGRYQFIFIGFIVLGFACVGEEFVFLWLGNEYSSVYICALLLMLPAPFFLSQQIGRSAMIVTGNIKYITWVNIAKAIINIVLVTILSSFWGAIGACLSICIVYFIRNSANMYLYRKVLKIDTSKFRKECYFKLIPVMLVTLFFGLLLKDIYSSIGWHHLLIKVVVIVIIYGGSMWFFGFNTFEKEELKNILRRLQFLKKEP